MWVCRCCAAESTASGGVAWSSLSKLLCAGFVDNPATGFKAVGEEPGDGKAKGKPAPAAAAAGAKGAKGVPAGPPPVPPPTPEVEYPTPAATPVLIGNTPSDVDCRVRACRLLAVLLRDGPDSVARQVWDGGGGGMVGGDCVYPLFCLATCSCWLMMTFNSFAVRAVSALGASCGGRGCGVAGPCRDRSQPCDCRGVPGHCPVGVSQRHSLCPDARQW